MHSTTLREKPVSALESAAALRQRPSPRALDRAIVGGLAPIATVPLPRRVNVRLEPTTAPKHCAHAPTLVVRRQRALRRSARSCRRRRSTRQRLVPTARVAPAWRRSTARRRRVGRRASLLCSACTSLSSSSRRSARMRSARHRRRTARGLDSRERADLLRTLVFELVSANFADRLNIGAGRRT